MIALIPLNLIEQPWLPVRRRSGAQGFIRPAQIVEGLVDDPITDFVWPRADFRIAAFEFLIGLLATACPPLDRKAWAKGWRKPPTEEELDAAFATIAPAFWLDGPGARFLQDHENLQSGHEPVERLLIEAPGESTIKRNADLFVHREQIQRLGRSAAAMALFTLQSWAPSGGAGNMTGLRGGGPLTTLVVPSENASLWQVLWANVPDGKPVKQADMPKVFPWLAPTVVSGKGGAEVYAGENAHPLQCWWGMPRRIRLDFDKSDGQICDLTNQPDDVLVVGWRQRPYGPKYAGWIGLPYAAGFEGVIHPLTPRYRQKEGAEWLAVHPQPGGIGYRHWAGIVVNSADKNKLPASCVAAWRTGRAGEVGLAQDPRLLAAGFDMDNMKARGFLESIMPLPGALDADQQEGLDILACQCVEAAVSIADILRGSVRDALFGKGTVSVDVTLLATLRERFWQETEHSFFALLYKAAQQDVDDVGLRQAWLAVLKRVALHEFDTVVVLAPDTEITEALRISKARRRVLAAVAGAGKEGKRIFSDLDIPPLTPQKHETTEKAP